jgi:hypothetical protein
VAFGNSHPDHSAAADLLALIIFESSLLIL